MNNYKRQVISSPTFTIDYLYRRFYKKLFNIVYSVFVWENLPDTFNENYITETLITTGNIGIIKTPNGIKPVRGNVGGEVNEFYRPTQFIYANPVLGSGSPKIGTECAVLYLTEFDQIPTDSNNGLSSLIETTAQLLADNILSLNISQKNARLIAFVTADNESTANSAEQLINSMYNGKPFKVISQSIADTIQVNPIATNANVAQNMRQLIENQQYILAHFMQELGINANFNLKRERLNTAEIELNSDCLDTLIDNIEKSVNDGLEVANNLFGTNMKLKLKRYGEEQETEQKPVALTQLDDTNDTDTDKAGDNDVG